MGRCVRDRGGCPGCGRAMFTWTVGAIERNDPTGHGFDLRRESRSSWAGRSVRDRATGTPGGSDADAVKVQVAVAAEIALLSSPRVFLVVLGDTGRVGADYTGTGAPRGRSAAL